MSLTFWFIVVGALLIGMALSASVLKRLPLTTSMFYLAAGVALGPAGGGFFDVHPVKDADLVEHITEIAVIVSLFTAGLKLRLPLRDGRWKPAAALATVAMALTVAAVAVVAVLALQLPLGAAILLGAILAPTDPVLASDVQVEHARDPERVRFSLTAEAGLNDGTAFPFVMLGLGLLGLRDIGDAGIRWALLDVVWAVGAGLATGALAGTLIGRLVVYLRAVHRQAVGLDDFLALGLIALSYGTALLIHAYGFLAVFAAGLALRRMERQYESAERARHTGAADRLESDTPESDRPPETTPAHMAEAVQGFNEQLERFGEVAVVILVGGMLAHVSWTQALWFTPVLLLLIRPASVFVTLLGSRLSLLQRGFIGWFGMRGVGSIYYLAYALAHGFDGRHADTLADLTLGVVAVSVVVHGVSVTPLMKWYEKQKSAPAAQP